ncbi:hypothetical protein BH23ACT9_BH23ACT9_36220 [soil metagenome]
MPLPLRRPLATLAALAVLALIASLMLGASASAQPDDPDGGPVDQPVGEPVTIGGGTSRLAGDTRIGTAIAIAQRAFPGGSPTVYIANADQPVDAVAGGSLTDGPILLVPACDLPDAVADELARLAPDEVIALGGTVAICDRVLESAASAAGIGAPGGDQPDANVTARVEITDASSTPPFTAAVTDPGVLFEGGTFTHELQLTGTDGDVVLDDPRFSAIMTHGDGQLVVTGRGCFPNVVDGQPGIVCQDDFQFLLIEEGQTTVQTLTLHTDDEQVGPVPVLPGTYILEQPIRWDRDTDPSIGEFDDGSATIRITYTVTAPDGGDEVVTWETPEGEFRTTGHSAADLERIADGVARREHIGIPNGEIRRGDGGVNTGRDWHLINIEIVDITIEVCDGTADYVSDNLEDYLAIGRYCPWGAVPVAIQTD